MMYWKNTYLLSILLLLSISLKSPADTLEKIRAIQSAGVDELPTLWKKHTEKSNFRYLVIARWIEIAPDDFFKNELSSQEFQNGWHIRGRLVGQSLDGPLIEHPLVQKMWDGRIIPYFFAGLAEVRPEEVMALVKTRKNPLHIYDQRTISAGIISGLAPTKADQAVALADEQSFFGWTFRNHRLATETTDFRIRSTWDSSALRRWVVFHPEEALSSISNAEGILFHPDLGATLALQLPDQVERLHQALPTGSKKRVIKEYIDVAKEKPDHVLNDLKMAPPTEIDSQYNFQTLLKTTTTIDPINFPAWLTDNRLDHLQPQEIRLLRSIIKDRWAKKDPESLLRFQDSRDLEDLSIGLQAWWGQDPQAATDYVKSKNEPATWNTFINSVALSNAKHALKLYRALPEDVKRWVANDGDEYLFTIAKGDREAFLNFALEQGEDKQKLLAILAEAWLRDDFAWTVETLTQHEVNPFRAPVYFPKSEWIKVPFDLLHKMPPDWKQTLLEPPHPLLRHDANRWISARNHPGLSVTQLRRIQHSLAANGSVIGWDDLPWAKHLVEKGDWLPDRTKNSLVDWAAIRSRDHEGFRVWVESLPPSINSKALEVLDEFRNEKIKEKEDPPDLSKSKKLSDFLANPGQQQEFSMSDWTIPEIRNFHDEIKEIGPKKAARLFKSVSIRNLPWQMRVTLIPKILENPDLVESNYLKFRIRATARIYANHQPALAAEWAMAFPDETLRILAAGIVAESWKNQNAEEAKTWVLSLPKPLQQRFGYGKDK